MSFFLFIIGFLISTISTQAKTETQLGMLHITGSVKNASSYSIKIKFLDNDDYEQTLDISSNEQENTKDAINKTIVINEGIYEITSVSSGKKMSYTLNSNNFKIKPNETYELELNAVFNNKNSKTNKKINIKKKIASGAKNEAYRIFCNSWWVFIIFFAGLIWYCIQVYKINKKN